MSGSKEDILVILLVILAIALLANHNIDEDS